HPPGLRAQSMNLDTAAVEQATGLKGQLIPEESVFKVTKPRTDVKIQVDQLNMPPFMGLGSWAAFTPDHTGAQALMMGEEGINIVAIHQHMSQEQPRYCFLHYWGKGKAVDLAQSLKRVLDAQAAVRI